MMRITHTARRNLVAGGLAWLWLAAALPGHGALLAYEPFDYPPGTPLVGRTNGFGFKAPWAPGGYNAKLYRLFRVKTGALNYPGLATEGHAHISGEAAPAQGIAGMGRLLATNLGTANTTCYLSFLHRPDGEGEFASIVLGTGAGNELAIGKSASTGEYYISNRGGVGRVLSGVPSVAGQTRFLVVKMEFHEGPDRFTLYIDPKPGSAEPANGYVKDDLDLTYADTIFLYSRTAWSVDEIRLGTTWADVTPAQTKPNAPK